MSEKNPAVTRGRGVLTASAGLARSPAFPLGSIHARTVLVGRAALSSLPGGLEDFLKLSSPLLVLIPYLALGLVVAL